MDTEQRPPGPAPDWTQRVAGSLLLTACGDALGAPFVGAARVDPAAVEAWMRDSAPLRWTDDTAMTRVLAAHLVRRAGQVDQPELAAEFTREWLREPDRSYGRGTTGVLAAVRDGDSWTRAAGGVFGGEGTRGNGAAMRVAPVALLAGVEPVTIAARADRSAAVTHAHRLGRDGAVVQAVAVALAARTAGGPVSPDRFLGRLAPHVRTTEFRQALQRVADVSAGPVTPATVAHELGSDSAALTSVPAALATFLAHPDQPRAALRFAICLGGDTDTVAAMTGALCGARTGAAAVPEAWTHRLEEAASIAALADSLARLPHR